LILEFTLKLIVVIIVAFAVAFLGRKGAVSGFHSRLTHVNDRINHLKVRMAKVEDLVDLTHPKEVNINTLENRVNRFEEHYKREFSHFENNYNKQVISAMNQLNTKMQDMIKRLSALEAQVASLQEAVKIQNPYMIQVLDRQSSVILRVSSKVDSIEEKLSRMEASNKEKPVKS